MDTKVHHLIKLRKYFTLEKRWGVRVFLIGITSMRVLRWLIFCLFVLPTVYFLHQRVGMNVDTFIHGITFSADKPGQINFPWTITDIELDNMAAVDFAPTDKNRNNYVLFLTILERDYADGVFLFRNYDDVVWPLSKVYFKRLGRAIIARDSDEKVLLWASLSYIKIYTSVNITADKLRSAMRLLNQYPPDIKGLDQLGLNDVTKSILILRFVPGAKIRVLIDPDDGLTFVNYTVGRRRDGKMVSLSLDRILVRQRPKIWLINP